MGAEATLSRSAIARRILRRCPTRTPRSLRSCSVRSRMTERSMALSAKRWAYSAKPSFSSQSAICCIATPPHIGPPFRVGLLHLQPAKEWHHVHPPIGGQRGAPGPRPDVRLGSDFVAEVADERGKLRLSAELPLAPLKRWL